MQGWQGPEGLCREAGEPTVFDDVPAKPALRLASGALARMQDTVAYTPGDIPAVPTANVVGEHYRGAFEAFCGEQAVKLTGEYRWIDPVLPTR